MKKILLAIFTFTFMVLLSKNVSAETTIDITEVNNNGIIKVDYDGTFDTKVGIKLQKAGETNAVSYVLRYASVSIPITPGNGTYTITIMKEKTAGKFAVVAKMDKIEAKITDLNKMYTFATPMIYFTTASTAVKGYTDLLKNAADIKGKVDGLYADIIKNYKYHDERAKAVGGKTGYLPTIDIMYKEKMGICFDYAALFAGVGRSMGIPVKLVMGYAPEIEVYHAWNEIYYGGKWVVVDLTYDAAYAQAGQKTTMVKDAKLFKADKYY